MNLFRLAGDISHFFSILVLFLKIRSTKSCAGISLKTQELYALVFLTQYLDLIVKYYSVYNTLGKLIFIGTSLATVWHMRHHKVVKQTYSKDQDTFRHYYLILLSLGLALLIPRAFTVIEVLWAFSIYLEAVAILPQLVLLQRSRNIDNLTGNYVFLLGAYRSLYLVNWIYRFFTELQRVCWIPWISGLVQTALLIFSTTISRAGRNTRTLSFLLEVDHSGCVISTPPTGNRRAMQTYLRKCRTKN